MIISAVITGAFLAMALMTLTYVGVGAWRASVSARAAEIRLMALREAQWMERMREWDAHVAATLAADRT